MLAISSGPVPGPPMLDVHEICSQQHADLYCVTSMQHELKDTVLANIQVALVREAYTFSVALQCSSDGSNLEACSDQAVMRFSLGFAPTALPALMLQSCGPDNGHSSRIL